MLSWHRQPKRDQTPTARRRYWPTRCGRYRVDGLRSLYGPKAPERFYALRVIGDRTEIISQHRTRNAAMQACENDLQQKETTCPAPAANATPTQTAARRPAKPKTGTGSIPSARPSAIGRARRKAQENSRRREPRLNF